MKPLAVSVRTAAKVLGCSRKTIRKLVHCGELPGAFLLLGGYRIPEDDMGAFRRRHAVGAQLDQVPGSRPSAAADSRDGENGPAPERQVFQGADRLAGGRW